MHTDTILDMTSATMAVFIWGFAVVFVALALA